MINYNMAQKEYKTSHDWVAKVIYWKLSKKLKFGHTNKWFVHKPESVLENETHKIFWDFKIQMDHPTAIRRPDQAFINKKKNSCHLVDFAVLVGLF